MEKQKPMSQSRRLNDIIVAHRRSEPAVRKQVWHKRLLRSKRLLPVALLCVVVFAASSLWLIIHARSIFDPGLSALQEVEKDVGRHYLLPTNEQPALITVEDETKVTSPFLKQAKNGDKLLVYAKAKIVIIYRPSIDRIVAVGPVFIDTSKDATAQ